MESHELLKKYNCTISDMMLIASLNSITVEELEDMNYIEEILINHTEFITQRSYQRDPVITSINKLAKSGIRPRDLNILINADFYNFIDWCVVNGVTMDMIAEEVNENPEVIANDPDLDCWQRIQDILETKI